MSDSLPDTMTAIEISKPGGPDVLIPATRPVPVPGDGEILVKVAAAGLNRADLAQRMGAYPPPPGASDIPGLEFAGTVVGMGKGVSGFSLGDEVCALTAGGGYAEYASVPAPQALPLPKDFTMVEGAALPETFFTVWTNVFDRARLRPGESLLVHGGSSGIGTTAIMLAHAFGSPVYATAGTAEKCEACVKLGAKRAINYKEEDFLEVIQAETDGRGVDVILDMVGGGYIEKNLQALAMEGRVVNVAFLEGAKAEINFGIVMMKRLTITGSTLRTRPVADKKVISDALLEKVWPLMNKGEIRPVIDSTYPLAKAGEAQARMATSVHIGKIILTT